jgi:hypothetical protein
MGRVLEGAGKMVCARSACGVLVIYRVTLALFTRPVNFSLTGPQQQSAMSAEWTSMRSL